MKLNNPLTDCLFTYFRHIVLLEVFAFIWLRIHLAIFSEYWIKVSARTFIMFGIKFQDDWYSDVQCKGQITFLPLYLGPQFKDFS